MWDFLVVGFSLCFGKTINKHINIILLLLRRGKKTRRAVCLGCEIFYLHNSLLHFPSTSRFLIKWFIEEFDWGMSANKFTFITILLKNRFFRHMRLFFPLLSDENNITNIWGILQTNFRHLLNTHEHEKSHHKRGRGCEIYMCKFKSDKRVCVGIRKCVDGITPWKYKNSDIFSKLRLFFCYVKSITRLRK